MIFLGASMAGLGSLSAHMLQHLVLMNVVVPTVVFFLHRSVPRTLWRSWPLATAAQLVLLWGWHAPSVLTLAMADSGLMLAMHLSLAGAAFWFWAAIASTPATAQWRSIIALLLTGKLFCLLGALLVFAPRTLYSGQMLHGPMGYMPDLADQQLAGLIMLTACPLVYVLSGIVIAARWFLSLEARANAYG